MEYQTAGMHSLLFDARLLNESSRRPDGQSSKLSRGFYLYKLIARQTDGGQAGEFVATREMLLMK